MKREQENFPNQFAYFQLQSTRSETLSMSVMDSPVGQASWIIEKFYYWTDKSRRPFEQIYSMDHLLTEVTIYYSDDRQPIVLGGDVIALPELLPGWSVPVSELWPPVFD